MGPVLIAFFGSVHIIDSSNMIARDLQTHLRCPACHATSLHYAEDALLCGACGATYRVDPATNAVSLLRADGNSPIKQDVQAWWADLYRQAYDGHETSLDLNGMSRRLTDLEAMFREREHLAVVEMPLDDLSGLQVLEIGSGSGAHSALFKSRGASVTSVDITLDRALATARKLALVGAGQGRAYQADGENLPFRDAIFDIVYSNGVLHHSEDTQRCIDEVYRVLKPNGRAVMMLYSRHSATYWLNVVPRALVSGEMFRWPEAQWIGRLTEGTPKFGEVKNPVTRVYSAKELRQALYKFKIESMRKASFQFDNICIPRMTQMRDAILRRSGYTPHPGGLLVYGRPTFLETPIELALGSFAGFAWNFVARKPAT